MQRSQVRGFGILFLTGCPVFHYIKFVVLFLALLLAGCGGNSLDKMVKSSLDAMKELTEAFEKGDKKLAMSAAKKMQAVAKEHKELKVSEAEDKRIQEKYMTQVQEQTKKMMEAMMKAVTSGKFTQEDMKEIGAMMQQMK